MLSLCGLKPSGDNSSAMDLSLTLCSMVRFTKMLEQSLLAYFGNKPKDINLHVSAEAYNLISDISVLCLVDLLSFLPPLLFELKIRGKDGEQ